METVYYTQVADGIKTIGMAKCQLTDKIVGTRYRYHYNQ